MTEPRRGRGRPPQVPPVPREPIGRDRVPAAGRPGRVSRPAGSSDRTERPDFPEGAQVDLPPRVRKDIERLVGDRVRATEVKLALSLGTIASEEEEHAAARRYLLWAKHLAPRSAVVRETLGIALYRAGDLRAALAELQAYRRLSGSADQNHLIADCLRAEGREEQRALELATELAEDPSQEIERRIEAAIVVAAIQLGRGRPARAGSALGRFLTGPDAASAPPASRVRLLWLAADVAEAEHRLDDALTALEGLRRLDPDYPEAEDRVARLRAELGR